MGQQLSIDTSAPVRQSRLGSDDRFELPNSEGTIAATDRRHVRTGHTRVTLAQAVAQFQRKSFEDE
jgi:hypothetical protein